MSFKGKVKRTPNNKFRLTLRRMKLRNYMSIIDHKMSM